MGFHKPVQNPAIPLETGADNTPQGRSTIRFPYLDQDDAVGIAKKIFEVRGNACEKDALAAALKVSADGGGFNLRLVTAKMFGLISGEKGNLQLTDLGLRVIDPQSEKAARSESFLLVPLYKAIYEAYRGQMLPGNPALEAQIEKLGVAPKQKDKARQVFQRSATQAGYFAFGNNRLVQPQLKAGSADVRQQKTELEGNLGGGGTGGNSGSGSGGGSGIPPELNPFIQGLLAELPPPKTVWSAEGRKNWLIGAASIFNLIYKADSADDYDLSITLGKTSAT